MLPLDRPKKYKCVDFEMPSREELEAFALSLTHYFDDELIYANEEAAADEIEEFIRKHISTPEQPAY